MAHSIKFRIETKFGVKPYVRLCNGVLEDSDRESLKVQMSNLAKSIKPDLNLYFHEYVSQETFYDLEELKMDIENLVDIPIQSIC